MEGKCFEEKIKNVVAYITSNTYPEGMNKAGRFNLRRFVSRFSMEDGTLYHSAKGRKVKVVHTMIEARTLFENYHASLMGGHEGIFKTRNKITSKYYWPGMTRDIVDWVARCPICQKHGKKLHVDNTMRSITALRVWDLLGMDLMGPLPETKNGNRYIMTVIDYVSKFVVAFPLKNKSALEVAEKMYIMFCMRGFPQRILTERGPEFCNKFNMFLCKKFNIERSFSSPYHPQTNGLVENANKKIKTALQKTVDENGTNWDEIIYPLLFAMRTKQHSSTKLTPFRLMFADDPIHQEEVAENYILSIPDLNTITEEFLQKYDIEKTLRHEADIEMALRNIAEAQEKQQRQYSKRNRSKYGDIKFDIGNSVLLLNARKRTRKGGVLEQTYRGPYKITSIEGKTVKLETVSGKMLATKYSIAHLKPFKEPLQFPPNITTEERIVNEMTVGNNGITNHIEKIQTLDGPESQNSQDQPLNFIIKTSAEEEEIVEELIANDKMQEEYDFCAMMMEDVEDKEWFQKEQCQKELEWRKARNNIDDITLAADTAHPNLSIAGDKKRLKHENQPQKVPQTRERFDSTFCGSQGFYSGKHYWEVDVESSTDWDLGVARKSIERNGKLSLSPKEGFWVSVGEIIGPKLIHGPGSWYRKIPRKLEFTLVTKRGK